MSSMRRLSAHRLASSPGFLGHDGAAMHLQLAKKLSLD